MSAVEPELRPRLRREGGEPYPGGSSLARLGGVLLSAVGLVWQAAPRHLLVIAGLQLVGAAATGAAVLVIRDVMAALTGAAHSGFGPVVPHLLLLAALLGVAGFAGALQRNLNLVLGELVQWHTNERVLDVTTTVELRAFAEPEFLNRLERALSNQGRPLQLTQGLLGMTGSVAILAGLVTALLLIQPLLVPVMLLAIVPLALASAVGSRSMHSFWASHIENVRWRGYLSTILTYGDHAKEVRSFRLGDFLRPVIRGLFEARLAELRRVTARMTVWSLAASLASSLALAGTVGVLAWLIADGRMGLPAAAAAAAILQLGGALAGLVSGVNQVFEGALFVGDYQAFTSLKPLIEAGRPTGVVPKAFDLLEVDGLSFTYPGGDHPALEAISLRMRRGEVVALVGENGSGKTTLAKLLCGLYSPDQGRILWDGKDLAQMDPVEVGKRVSIIFQDFGQYWLSARQNVGIGAVEKLADSSAITTASRQAGADEFLAALPEGYATMLGHIFEGGQWLSTGQWQRVALARAFLRDAPLLILDEPTAALDPRAESALFESIRSLQRGRTVVLISHRFSSVVSADRIYVMRAGRMVEEGSHTDLLAAGGLYAELFNLQAATYVDAVGSRA